MSADDYGSVYTYLTDMRCAYDKAGNLDFTQERWEVNSVTNTLKWSDPYNSNYCCVGGSSIFTGFHQYISRGIAFTNERWPSAQKPHLVTRWVHGLVRRRTVVGL